MTPHTPETGWFICSVAQGNACLYSQSSVDRMPTDPPRCIRHGQILDCLGRRYDGRTRVEARALLKEIEP